jgi:hypothetical protein
MHSVYPLMETFEAARQLLSESPSSHRIDLDYVENGTHQTRNVYYDTQATRWNGVRDNEVRTGDRIVARGHQDKGHWQADEVRRHE